MSNFTRHHSIFMIVLKILIEYLSGKRLFQRENFNPIIIGIVNEV